MSIDGLLPVDKPGLWTSHDVVDWVRRRFRVRKVGHTGTLDPIATGVLVLCLGRATRLSPFLAEQDKTYRARIRLGVRTDTLDADGAVISRSDRIPQDAAAAVRAVRCFEGEVEQIPPMFSARKVKGRRLYELAREGQVVARQPRRVRIHRIEVEAYEPPMLTLTISCSKGTYIRTLADDLGAALGCGGHIAALRRIAAGPIAEGRCVPLGRLEGLDSRHALAPYLLDPNEALAHLPGFALLPEQARRFVHGNPVSSLKGAGPDGLARALGAGGALLGIGRWAAGEGILKPVRVFATGDGEGP